ncbi:MAG: cyclic nucleotide-binding domain-containing protein [Desulfobacterales bacterium]|nr:cyclic nucleotide-binding domain-containing protein [Desulfobacterales bacterium]
MIIINEPIWNKFRKIRKKTTIDILSKNYLFQDLTSKELKILNAIVHERTYVKDEVIFRQNDTGVGMYIISKGAVDIIAENYEDRKMEETIIVTLNEDDFFGELSLIEENGKRSATAKATFDTSLIGFFKPNLMEIMKMNPGIGVKITWRLCQVLGQRLKDTTDNLANVKQQLSSQEVG